eukprot:6211864-Pleurochrysis_carterae.AAC.3
MLRLGAATNFLLRNSRGLEMIDHTPRDEHINMLGEPTSVTLYYLLLGLVALHLTPEYPVIRDLRLHIATRAGVRVRVSAVKANRLLPGSVVGVVSDSIRVCVGGVLAFGSAVVVQVRRAAVRVA